MTPLDRLLTGLLPAVPDYPEPVALHWLRESAAKLCTESGIWRAPIVMPVTAGQVATPIPLPAGAALVGIQSAKFNGYPLTPKSDAAMDEQHPDWLDGIEGAPFCYAEGAANALTPYPTATGSLALRVTLKPALAATELPRFLVEDYASAIQAGALAMLYLLPGKAWSNPQAVGTQMALFNDGVLAARDRAQHGKHGAPIRTQPHFF
ncbi:hypothetical protein [Chitinimonas sp. BJB300]|uniref:hypothetical protein n=2 Tax=Chitinimonas sp. BJB300 TaxID=1559339 RepID=UPI0011125E43|nr:hypothetical protein [Chitinimonas sp. BJB300]TSJ85956.1 hypothetical protein FG002_017220 [Chitinimonas sp. BJB300]